MWYSREGVFLDWRDLEGEREVFLRWSLKLKECKFELNRFLVFIISEFDNIKNFVDFILEGF